MKILLVEDEAKTATFLKKGLSENGFVLDVAEDGETGLHLAREGSFDLVILDVMLPERDGWSVLREIRTRDKNTPIIFLTARDSVPDRVRGLEEGADDYLVKPFAFSELLARIRTVLRRNERRSEEFLRFSGIEMDLLRRSVSRDGSRLDLTAKEFLLLELFMQHPEEVLSRTFIAERVWDMNFDSDTNTVDVAVRRLRKKVDEPFSRKLIHTIRGMGYILENRS
ncbi:MAG: heavy metal response regulator transcription factor [Nitrospiraceae bacterium]|nr:heavy metal response regulator transcription factor [Nitrospiraceae bacterium]